MTHHSLEEINLFRERSLLLIKGRWFLAALLIVYTSITFYIYSSIYNFVDLIIKFGALYVVIFILILFNGLLHWSYTNKDYVWRYKINSFIFGQLILDLFCNLLFIYLTGGISSWLITLLMFFTIELTFFMPDIHSIIKYGSACLGLFTLLVLGEFFKFIPSYDFVSRITFNDSFYSFSAIWLVIVTVNTLTAYVSYKLRVKEEPEFIDRAIKDTQTKLYNRRRFNSFLNNEVYRAIRYKRVISLMIIKVENLDDLIKEIGLKEGDKVLEMIGVQIRNNFRRSDTLPSYDIDIACRYSSDTFAVILPETDVLEAINPAKRVQNKIRYECGSFSKKVPVCLSIGLASYPTTSIDTKSIVKNALDAVKRSRALGKIELSKTINVKHKVLDRRKAK